MWAVKFFIYFWLNFETGGDFLVHSHFFDSGKWRVPFISTFPFPESTNLNSTSFRWSDSMESYVNLLWRNLSAWRTLSHFVFEIHFFLETYGFHCRRRRNQTYRGNQAKSNLNICSGFWSTCMKLLVWVYKCSKQVRIWLLWVNLKMFND